MIYAKHIVVGYQSKDFEIFRIEEPSIEID